MKYALQFLVLSLGLVFSGKVHADVPSSSLKLGVVDLQRALNSVEEGKSARDKFKKDLDASQKEIDKRKAELEKLRKELEDYQTKAQSGLLKPEALEQARKKQGDFQKKVEDYTSWVDKTQGDLAKKEQDATQGILARLKPMVDDVGRKEAFTMIFERNQSGLIYASSYTDVTEKVIQEFNKSGKSTTSKK